MIVPGHLIYADPVEANGVLFVGDPQYSAKKPGRRKDANWPEPILRKLEACRDAANERRLVPLMLGDVLDEPVEADEGLKTALIQVLKGFWMPVITNTGNHDMAFSTLSRQDSLFMLAVADVLDVVTMSGPVIKVAIGDKTVGFGMTPYGQDIPRDVRAVMPECDAVVWMTHHDIAFDNSYPGALPPFPIDGCGLAVNGHIHSTKEKIRVGGTLWFNPGNITRQTKDVIDHVPRAWALLAGGRIEPVELPHEKDVFDLTGSLVDAITDPGEDGGNTEMEDFSSLLKAEESTQMERSQDGSILLEEVQAKFETDRTDEETRAVIASLWQEAVARRRA